MLSRGGGQRKRGKKGLGWRMPSGIKQSVSFMLGLPDKMQDAYLVKFELQINSEY